MRRRALGAPVGAAPRVHPATVAAASDWCGPPTPRIRVRRRPHRDRGQRTARAAALPARARGRGGEVPVARVGGAGRGRGDPAPAAALPGGGAPRSRLPRRRLRDRGGRSRPRTTSSGRSGLRALLRARRAARAPGASGRRHRGRPRGSARRRGRDRGATSVATAGPTPPSPLAGIRVIDLGLAVAGPWGTMMLADLGAEVIKVNALHDGYWMSSHIAMCCNRGKRSIAMNLKDPAAMEVLLDLVATADIVQHNMRYDAAVRLRCRLREPAYHQARPDLLPYAGLRARRARGTARQRPDRGCARRTRLARRRPRPRRHPVVARGLAGRHRQRVPLGHRDGAGALPPRPHR